MTVRSALALIWSGLGLYTVTGQILLLPSLLDTLLLLESHFFVKSLLSASRSTLLDTSSMGRVAELAIELESRHIRVPLLTQHHWHHSLTLSSGHSCSSPSLLTSKLYFQFWHNKKNVRRSNSSLLSTGCLSLFLFVAVLI